MPRAQDLRLRAAPLLALANCGCRPTRPRPADAGRRFARHRAPGLSRTGAYSRGPRPDGAAVAKAPPGGPADDLLWVYEGLAEYSGKALATRAGLRNQEQFRDILPSLAAEMEFTPGRAWRPRQDTADEAQILDDFARLFFGLDDAALEPQADDCDDSVAALDKVQHYKWAHFLCTRLDSNAPAAPVPSRSSCWCRTSTRSGSCASTITPGCAIRTCGASGTPTSGSARSYSRAPQIDNALVGGWQTEPSRRSAPDTARRILSRRAQRSIATRLTPICPRATSCATRRRPG